MTMTRNNDMTNTILVTNVNSNSISLIDENNNKNKLDIAVGVNPHEVIVSPNGSYALVSNFGNLSATKPGETLTSIDIKNARVIETIQLEHGSRPHGIAFMSDSQALVTAQGIQSLLIINFDENFQHATIKEKIKLPGRGAHMVKISNDKKYVYVANMQSGTVCQIDMENVDDLQHALKELKIGKHAEGLALTKDGKILLVTNMVDSTLTMVNTGDFSINKTIKTSLGPTRVELFNNDKFALVVDSVAGKVNVVDMDAFKIVNTFKTTQSGSYKKGNYFAGLFGCLPVPVNVSINKDQIAYITNLYAGNVSQLDLKSGMILKTFEASNEPDGIDVINTTFQPKFGN